MSNHSVSDLVTRIRNGYLAGKNSVNSPVSKLREAILKLLKEEGYILNYSKEKQKDNKDGFKIHLKYHLENPVISEVTTISKPGKRVYTNCDEIPVINNGLGAVILSTSKGVITDHEAREKKLGGEILLTIF